MEDLFEQKGLVTNKDGGLFSWLFKNRDNDSSDKSLTDKEYEDKIKENYKDSLTKEVVVNADKLIGPDSYSVTRYPDDYSMLQKNFYKNFTDRTFKDKLQKNYGLSDSDYATVINTVYGLANSEIRASYGVGDTVKNIAKAVGVVDDDENSRGLMNIKFNTNSDALEGMGFKESDLDDDKKSLRVAASIIADRIKHLKKFKNFSNYNAEGKKLLASYAYKQGLSKINNDNLGEFMKFTGEEDNGYYLFPEESKTYDYFNEWLSAVGEKENKKKKTINITKEDIVPIKGMQSGSVIPNNTDYIFVDSVNDDRYKAYINSLNNYNNYLSKKRREEYLIKERNNLGSKTINNFEVGEKYLNDFNSITDKIKRTSDLKIADNIFKDKIKEGWEDSRKYLKDTDGFELIDDYEFVTGDAGLYWIRKKFKKPTQKVFAKGTKEYDNAKKQEKLGIDVDGVWGKQSQSALDKYNKHLKLYNESNISQYNKDNIDYIDYNNLNSYTSMFKNDEIKPIAISSSDGEPIYDKPKTYKHKLNNINKSIYKPKVIAKPTEEFSQNPNRPSNNEVFYKQNIGGGYSQYRMLNGNEIKERGNVSSAIARIGKRYDINGNLITSIQSKQNGGLLNTTTNLVLEGANNLLPEATVTAKATGKGKYIVEYEKDNPYIPYRSDNDYIREFQPEKEKAINGLRRAEYERKRDNYADVMMTAENRINDLYDYKERKANGDIKWWERKVSGVKRTAKQDEYLKRKQAQMQLEWKNKPMEEKIAAIGLDVAANLLPEIAVAKYAKYGKVLSNIEKSESFEKNINNITNISKKIKEIPNNIKDFKDIAKMLIPEKKLIEKELSFLDKMKLEERLKAVKISEDRVSWKANQLKNDVVRPVKFGSVDREGIQLIDNIPVSDKVKMLKEKGHIIRRESDQNGYIFNDNELIRLTNNTNKKSLHFTSGGKSVNNHMSGNWDNAGTSYIIPFNDFGSLNGMPRSVALNDTYWYNNRLFRFPKTTKILTGDLEYATKLKKANYLVDFDKDIYKIQKKYKKRYEYLKKLGINNSEINIDKELNKLSKANSKIHNDWIAKHDPQPINNYSRNINLGTNEPGLAQDNLRSARSTHDTPYIHSETIEGHEWAENNVDKLDSHYPEIIKSNDAFFKFNKKHLFNSSLSHVDKIHIQKRVFNTKKDLLKKIDATFDNVKYVNDYDNFIKQTIKKYLKEGKPYYKYSIAGIGTTTGLSQVQSKQNGGLLMFSNNNYYL